MFSFARFSLFVAFAASSKLVHGEDRPQALRIKNAANLNPARNGQQGRVVGGAVDQVLDEIVAIAEAFDFLQAPNDPMMSMSMSISDSPSAVPSAGPSASPSTSFAPSTAPSKSKTSAPTVATIAPPSAAPSTEPSAAPSVGSSTLSTNAPTDPGPVTITAAPVFGGVVLDSSAPTPSPTNQKCPGITAQQRRDQILARLDEVANFVDIRDESTPQGLATTWIIEQDEFDSCPDDEKLIQRWVLAVIYFSTNGDDWFQCSANPNATDNCGVFRPFRGKERFLSSGTECTWAGISCDNDGCVTEIEFEENNLVGTIATEIGLLDNLLIWGMERGNLTSTIPTEVGKLTNLIFIDLDFNELTGSLTSELLSLSALTQLDLNNNKLTGSINGIGVFPDMEFLQLHKNDFTGTVPEAVGNFTELTAFTLHGSNINGTMPQSVCDLLTTEGNGGFLTSLIADCEEGDCETPPTIECDCCTDCRKAIASDCSAAPSASP